MLTVKNIAKRLPDGRLLLKNISFEAKKGEFIGIMGKSGTGKTVLLRCINGLTAPDKGEILINEGNYVHKVNEKKGKELRQIRQRVAVIFQSFNLVKRLSVLENVMTGRLGRIGTWRSLFYGFTDQEVIMARQALRRVGVEHLAGRRAETLSGGEMQRVAIAKALMQEPYLLLADEPVANLDPQTSDVVLEYLQPLTKDMAILGVFHTPDIVRKYCTRAIGIKDGLVVYDGSPDLSERDLENIYGGQPAQRKPALVVQSA
ncbi:MAG: phosphonate ABC transporter ATP-binding protein [Desulfotomaculum sp.]|nr:phosphonate ABC transporter ATP-binding protein [Desulfotomaculum sp.]MCL0081239.1 phosphonate ABC transporter ATP-binding protein [Peptococcaceae bacterium]